MTPEQEDYVRRFLGGTGIYSHLIVKDKSVSSFFSPVDESPATAADRLLVAYIRDRVRRDVTVETVHNGPSPYKRRGMPKMSSSPPALRTFPAGVAIIAIQYRVGPLIPNFQEHEVIPYIAFYGDPASTGAGPVALKEHAPGDVPCPPRRPTGEEIFSSVKGRIDLILRNSLC